jgi:type VI secretion system protein ImpE
VTAVTASDLFRGSQLRAAIDAQVQKVRANPADNPARFFLFELFLFAGDLDRARKQLDVLRYDDPRHTAAVQQYRSALDAETRRRAVFAGTEQPKGLTTAPEHVRLRLDALPYLARGEYPEAARLLAAANTAVPVVRGTLNGKPVEGLYDADERLGTVLEVFGTGGTYSWVPLEQVESVTLNAPQNPRDVVWRPAHLVLTDGPEGDVLLPGLYPDSHAHRDDEVKCGRATEWVGADGEILRGAGGKLFLTGDGSVEFTNITDFQRAAD